MARSYRGTRMFDAVTRTWNPITGCLHYCKYCWAMKLVETRLRKITRKYRRGFKPAFHPEELDTWFRPGEFVFCCDMGDAFGEWVPDEWILRVLDVVERFPKTTFLFLTKNPARYARDPVRSRLEVLENIIAGATIETDDDGLYESYGISYAPPPGERMEWMRYVSHRLGGRVMVSVEPVLDFSDPKSFAERIAELEPRFVYVGYDNYSNRLPEPPLEKVLELIDQLRSHGVEVREKTIRKAWWEQRGHDNG